MAKMVKCLLKKGFKYMESDVVNNINKRHVGPCEVTVTQTTYDGNPDVFEPLVKAGPVPVVDLSDVQEDSKGGDGA